MRLSQNLREPGEGGRRTKMEASHAVGDNLLPSFPLCLPAPSPLKGGMAVLEVACFPAFFHISPSLPSSRRKQELHGLLRDIQVRVPSREGVPYAAVVRRVPIGAPSPHTFSLPGSAAPRPSTPPMASISPLWLTTGWWFGTWTHCKSFR